MRPSATSVLDLQLLAYEAFSYQTRHYCSTTALLVYSLDRGLLATTSPSNKLCMRPSATSVWGLKLLAYEVFSYRTRGIEDLLATNSPSNNAVT
jgi:hypothetical protein